MKRESTKGATIRMVNNFLDTNPVANTIRTIWYQIKHEIQPWQPTKQSEKDFSDYINSIAGKHLWNLYLSGTRSIYEALGIKSKAMIEGTMPVVLFCEKQLPDFDRIAEELDGCIYLSSGQIPNFEIAQAARLLAEMEVPRVYLFGLTDYDPAGLSIYSSLAEKLEKALNIETGYETELICRHITFDDMTKYDSYELSADESKRWDNGDRGIELDTVAPEERIDAVMDTIEHTIDPYDYEQLSLQRARDNEVFERIQNSNEHRILVAEINKLRDSIKDDVDALDYDFNADMWSKPRAGMVVNMTTLEVA